MEFVKSVFNNVIVGFRLIFATFGLLKSHVDREPGLIMFLADKSYNVGIIILVFGFCYLVWTIFHHRNDDEIKLIRTQLLLQLFEEIDQDEEDQYAYLNLYNTLRVMRGENLSEEQSQSQLEMEQVSPYPRSAALEGHNSMSAEVQRPHTTTGYPQAKSELHPIRRPHTVPIIYTQRRLQTESEFNPIQQSETESIHTRRSLDFDGSSVSRPSTSRLGSYSDETIVLHQDDD